MNHPHHKDENHSKTLGSAFFFIIGDADARASGSKVWTKHLSRGGCWMHQALNEKSLMWVGHSGLFSQWMGNPLHIHSCRDIEVRIPLDSFLNLLQDKVRTIPLALLFCKISAALRILFLPGNQFISKLGYWKVLINLEEPSLRGPCFFTFLKHQWSTQREWNFPNAELNEYSPQYNPVKYW